MSITVTYPYDPAGTNEACYLKGESYSLSSINNTFRCIIPESAPFYKDGLVVLHATSNKVLREGVDYRLGHQYLEIAEIASRDVFGSISFINPELFGEIKLSYRTVGGNYIQPKAVVANYLVNLLIDPVQVYWDDVFGRPEYYPAVDHEQIYSDFVNTQAIATAIDGVESALETYAAKTDIASIAFLNNRITQLDALVESTNFDAHIINRANPHQTTHTQADALHKDAQAVQAIKLYAKTLIELGEYVNARGITQAHLDAYLPSHADKIITNRLILKNGLARIRNSGVESILDLSNGQIIMTCKNTGKLLANDHRAVSDGSAYLIAGNNTLRVHSTNAGVDRDGLTYNNKVVIHLGNLREYLGTVNFGVVHVTTSNTTTGQWSGIGTEADPLSVAPIYPVASTAVTGIAKLYTSGTSTDETMAATAKSLSDIVTALAGYVLKTRTVNGQSLASNITFTKSDFGLGLVNNTSDVNKPVSGPQLTELNRLANTGHKHPAGDVVFPNATTAQHGLTMLSTTVGDVDSQKATTPKVLTDILTHDTAVKAKVPQLLDASAVRLMYYRPSGDVVFPTTTDGVDVDGNPVVIQPANWWLATLPAGQYYLKETDYEVPTTGIALNLAFPTGYVSKTFYIHVQLVNDNAEYLVSATKLLDTDTRLFIGTLATNATQALSSTLDSRVSLGMYRELQDHLADPLAHGYGSGNKAQLGLDLVNDYPMQHYAHPFSPAAIRDTWLPMSENLAGLTALWNVAELQNQLNIPLQAQTSAYAGKYLTAQMWERLQFVSGSLNQAGYLLGVTVTNKGSDAISTMMSATEVVLGVHVVNGITHKLSLMHNSHATDVNLIVNRLYYNYGMAGQLDLGSFMDPAYMLRIDTAPNGAPLITHPDRAQLKAYLQVNYAEENSSKFIEVVTRTAIEWGVPSRVGVSEPLTNRLITRIALADIPVCPYREELFNSGSVGFVIRRAVEATVYYSDVTTPYSKSQYASANLLNELAKRGTGIQIIQGILSGSQNGYPIPIGCSKVLVLYGPRSLVAASGAGLLDYDFNSLQVGDGSAVMASSSYMDAVVCGTDQIEISNANQSYNYTVIGFSDEINLIEIP